MRSSQKIVWEVERSEIFEGYVFVIKMVRKWRFEIYDENDFLIPKSRKSTKRDANLTFIGFWTSSSIFCENGGSIGSQALMKKRFVKRMRPIKNLKLKTSIKYKTRSMKVSVSDGSGLDFTSRSIFGPKYFLFSSDFYDSGFNLIHFNEIF